MSWIQATCIDFFENIFKILLRCNISGLCNCCRCGCGGRYFDAGTVGFKRALNKIQKPDFEPLAEGTEVIAPAHGHSIVKSEGIVYDRTYLDIPYNKDNDKCFCLYFD